MLYPFARSRHLLYKADRCRYEVGSSHRLQVPCGLIVVATLKIQILRPIHFRLAVIVLRADFLVHERICPMCAFFGVSRGAYPVARARLVLFDWRRCFIGSQWLPSFGIVLGIPWIGIGKRAGDPILPFAILPTWLSPLGSFCRSD